METIGRRIKRLRVGKGLTQVELGSRLNANQHYISRFESDEFSNPTLDTIEKIAKALDVHSSEILYGASLKSEKSIPDDDFSPGRKITNGIKLVPVLGHAMCRRWKDFSDLKFPTAHADEWIPAPTKDPNAFFIIAFGDSMIDGDIREGDMLLVEPNTELYNGCKVLAKDRNKGCTVKLFYREKGKIRLQPMNPSYPPIYIDEKDEEDLRVYRIAAKLTKF